MGYYEEDISGDLRGMIIKSVEIQSERIRERKARGDGSILNGDEKSGLSSQTWKECHQRVSRVILEGLAQRFSVLGKDYFGVKPDVRYVDDELVTVQFENGFIVEVTNHCLDNYVLSIISSDAQVVYESNVNSSEEVLKIVCENI